MRQYIFACLLLIFLVSGCKTMTEKEKVLSKGDFNQKVDYLEKNGSDKREVIEFIGQPSQKRDLDGVYTIWYYNKTEEPLEITFGSGGRVMYIEHKSLD